MMGVFIQPPLIVQQLPTTGPSIQQQPTPNILPAPVEPTPPPPPSSPPLDQRPLPLPNHKW